MALLLLFIRHQACSEDNVIETNKSFAGRFEARRLTA